MSRGKRKSTPEIQRRLVRYNHVMELLIEFMGNNEGKYSDYTLQEFWSWLQTKRDEEGGENIEI